MQVHLARLRALGQIVAHGFLQRGHVNGATQRRLRERNGDFNVQIIAVALEQLVRPHGDQNLQVARRAAVFPRFALAADGHDLAIVHARQGS